MTNQSRFIPRTRVFWRLFLVNLLLCIISVSILCAVFLPFMHQIAETNDENWNGSRLFACQSYWDSLQNDAKSIVTQIEQSQWIYPLFIDHVLSKGSISNDIRSSISQDMAGFRARYSSIQSVSFWFYRNPSEIYTFNGIFTNRDMLQELFPEKIDYAYLPLEDAAPGFSSVEYAGTTYLSYRTPFRDVSAGSDKGEIVIIFNPEKIRTQLFDSMDQSVTALSILSHDDETLYTVSLSDSLVPTVSISTDAASYVYEIELFASSRHNSQSRMLGLTSFAVFLDLLTCVVLSLVLTSANYRPFGSIIQEFVGDVPSNGNEFTYLSQFINNIQQNCADQAMTIAQLQPLVQNNIVSQILSGVFSMSGDFSADLDASGVVFSHPLYNVVNLYLKTTDHLLTILDAFADYQQKSLDVLVYPHIASSNCLTLLVNYQNQKVLEKMIQMLEMQLHKSEVQQFYIGIGQPSKNWDHVYMSSEQANRALNAALLNPSSSVLWFSMLQTTTGHDYNYSYSEEVLLSQAIIGGQELTAEKILRDVVDRNANSGEACNLMLLFFNLYSTISRSTSGLGIEIPPINQLMFPSSYAQLYLETKKLLQLVFRQLTALKGQIGKTMEDEILDYIDKNLYLPDLSLVRISERFSKSTSYISAMFKRRRGSNFNAYVNEKRIERAVTLLNDSSADIEDIRDAVGYISQSTFTRNFKKYTGHLPPQR